MFWCWFWFSVLVRAGSWAGRVLVQVEHEVGRLHAVRRVAGGAGVGEEAALGAGVRLVGLRRDEVCLERADRTKSASLVHVPARCVV